MDGWTSKSSELRTPSDVLPFCCFHYFLLFFLFLFLCLSCFCLFGVWGIPGTNPFSLLLSVSPFFVFFLFFSFFLPFFLLFPQISFYTALVCALLNSFFGGRGQPLPYLPIFPPPPDSFASWLDFIRHHRNRVTCGIQWRVNGWIDHVLDRDDCIKSESRSLKVLCPLLFFFFSSWIHTVISFDDDIDMSI